MAEMTRGERNIAWIEEYCVVPEGRDVGKPVVLRDWQKLEIKRIYDNPQGTRRAILSFGRKNGKTAISAFLCLLHLCGPEAKPNSQLFSAAQSREQAAILFNLAAKVVRMSPELSKFIIVRDSGKQLYCEELGSLYRALSADASTAYGLSPVFIVHDELGQVRGPSSELYEALETATGAQESPLSIVISTQAPNPTDLLSLLIDDAQEGGDDRVVLSLYSAPEDIDPFSDEAILAANPAFGDFQNAEETRSMAKDANRMPSREPEYRNLILNQRVEMFAPFISRSIWGGCGHEPLEFGDSPVFAGLDLSTNNDLTACVYISHIDGKWHVKPRFWLPLDGLSERSRRDRVPYHEWYKQDFIEARDGPVVDYEFAAQCLFQDSLNYNIQKIGFDRWNWPHLKPWLLKAGFRQDQVEGEAALFHQFGQGYQSMSPALKTLEGIVLQGEMAHGNHPVLTMCMANAVVTTDPAGNRKLDKKKATGRIDGAVALAMAVGTSSTFEAAKESYLNAQDAEMVIL